MGRPKRQKQLSVIADIANGGQLQSGSQSGVIPLPPPTSKDIAAASAGTFPITTPATRVNRAGPREKNVPSSVGEAASDSLGGRNQDQPAAKDGGPDSEKRLAAPVNVAAFADAEHAGTSKAKARKPASPALEVRCETVQLSTPAAPACATDSPDMRRIGTWVMRHLDAAPGDYAYPAPDGMALALLSACQNDPKFRSSFIAKVFDRMMVQDAVSTQNKYSDDNADLRKLLQDVSFIAAGCKK